MVAIIAVYLFAVEVITMQTNPRKFLVLHHTNGKLQFKTACLGPDQCHRGEHSNSTAEPLANSYQGSTVM